MLLVILMTSIIEGKNLFPQDADVLFITEEHTSKEDHRFQLEMIKLLYEKHKRVVIAMEMFQQSFQGVLDKYVSCEIEEEEMLRRTEYSKRWGYDPELYRDIWRFAKEKGIRIFAINLPSELLQAIRSNGLKDTKSPMIPQPIISQTEKERERLRQVLKNHPKVDEERFFDVQNAWDNGMALAIARILESYPEYKVVVLLGRGHAEDYDEGVPRRLRALRPNVRMVILRREGS